MQILNIKYQAIILVLSVSLLSIFFNFILKEISIYISTPFICILIGCIINNFYNVNVSNQEIFKFFVDKVLKFVIAILGLRLSIQEIYIYGSDSIFIIIINIILTFLIVVYLCKILKVNKKLGQLIFMGTSICGVTAIIATSSLIKPKKSHITSAVSTITLFGMISLIFYPYLVNLLFPLYPQISGIFLGLSINDTAQVTAAGMIYQENFDSKEALNAAITTKLLRNSFLIILIPMIAFFYKYKTNGNISNSFINFIPLFVIGFISFSFIRTIGDIYLIGEYYLYWNNFINFSNTLSNFLLLTAMTALGLQTNLKDICEVGFKPVIIGFLATVLIAISSVLLLSF